MNHLYYGDNLKIMQRMAKDSVDLIYLDPPFNSKKNYNLMYKTMTGKPVPEQADAFCDTWEMDSEKIELAKKMPVLMREYGVEEYYVEFWRLWINALRNTQPHLLAYLIYMVQRLLQMKVILRPAGSIYLHCDPTASHYIKVMMDGIFGHQHFRNEIIWKRTTSHNSAQRFGPVHDVILCYSKGDSPIWNPQHQSYGDAYRAKFGKTDEKTGMQFQDQNLTGPGVRTGPSGQPWRGCDPTAIGRHWQPASYLYDKYREITGDELNQYHLLERFDKLDEVGLIYWSPKKGGLPRYKQFLDDAQGVLLADVWTDIDAINSQAKERLGYPTQKPIALLDRIILASSREGDVVFDPFCGCGTTIYSAEKNNRRWIGCDIAILSVRLVTDMLTSRYRLVEGVNFDVTGIPASTEQAEALFKQDPFQFQHWVVEKIGGFPMLKKVADRGIDGRVYFETKRGLKDMVLSVKGGTIRPTDIRDLRGVLEREENAEMAGFLSLREPTKAMRDEAAEAGMFEYGGTSYPRIQLLTVREVFEERREFQTPSRVGAKIQTGQINLPLPRDPG